MVTVLSMFTFCVWIGSKDADALTATLSSIANVSTAHSRFRNLWFFFIALFSFLLYERSSRTVWIKYTIPVQQTASVSRNNHVVSTLPSTRSGSASETRMSS